MKTILYLFILLFLLVNSVFAQIQIPFSRSDSASIVENNQRYEEFFTQGDKKEASRNLDLNAVLYWKHNYFDDAIQYYSRSLELNKQLGNQNGIAGINSNLALIYADKGDYQKSLDYFEKTLAVRKSNKEKIGIISALINESVVLNKMSRYDESVIKLEEALTYAREMNDEEQMRSIYGMLSETYQKAGNTDKAMYYYEYYKTFNDYVTDKVITESNEKLQKEILQKQLLELENENKNLQLEKQNWIIKQKDEEIGEITTEQQNLIDSLSKQEMAYEIIKQKNQIQNLENLQLIEDKKTQKLVILIISIALVLVLISMLFLYFMFRQKNKLNKLLVQKNALINQQKEEISTQRDELLNANKLLDNKNNEITSSITYARRIQKAILSGSTDLNILFNDSFLIYMPRDIVSGDFYYFKKIAGDEKIIIVGDCTGHGVPGAFLTVLGANILNTIIIDREIYEPSEIIVELDKQYFLMLNQGKTEVNDGMDVSVCKISKENDLIIFSGARNPLVIVTQDKINYVDAVRASIGLSVVVENKNKNFTSNTFEIKEKTWCYMFSDGFTDQFDSNKKKYSRKRLLENLKNIFETNGKNQEIFLKDDITKWKDDCPQTDDIIMLGFQLNGNKKLNK